MHNILMHDKKSEYINSLDQSLNSGLGKLRARFLLCSEILRNMRQSRNVEEEFQEIASKVVNVLQNTKVSIYKLDRNIGDHDRTGTNGQIVAEAIAPNCKGNSYSRTHIKTILRAEYQWVQEILQQITDFDRAGLTRCDLNFAEVFANKAYLLIPIVLSAQEIPLWGFLIVRQCKALNKGSLQNSWDQDNVLTLQQIAIQIEIALQSEHHSVSLQEQVREAEQSYSTLHGWMERYRCLVEEFPNVSYVSPITNNPEFTYISPQLKTLLCIPPSQWNVVDSWEEHVHPDDRDRVQQEIRHTIDTGEPFCCEYRMIATDGRIIWVRDNAQVRLASDGKTRVLRGSTFDISDRKQIEQALTKSEAILATSQQIAKLGNWEWYVFDNQITWSKEMFHIFERDPALGTPDYEEHLLHFLSEDREKLDQAVQSAVNSGESYQIELQILRSDKSYHYIEAIGHAEYDDNQQVSKLYGTVQDISDRKATQTKLRYNEALLQLTVKNAPVGIATISSEGKFLNVNQRFCEIYGYAEKELCNMTVFEITHPNFVKPTLKALNSLVDNLNTNIQIKKQYIHKDTHVIEAISRFSAMQNESGRAIQFVASVEDVTDREQIEAKLAAASLAEAANIAKTEFLAVMSHELRTPMNAVIGMTDILLDTPLSPEQQGYVAMIQKGGEMLLSVISNILDFSRIESGKFELEELPLNLRQCIKEVLGLMTSLGAEKSLKLDALISIDVPQRIMGDYGRLRQILLNLVSNAIKFTESGKVVIESSAQLLDQSTNTYELRFDVRDTGIGISDQQIAKLFKAFSQADKSITRQYGGTGLGLVICKQLSELMGGSISVTSTVGVGSTFSCSIVGQAIEASVEAIASNLVEKKILSHLNQNFASRYPFKILVVEDNLVNQQILLLMLNKLGYTPQAFSNGLEVLTHLGEQSSCDVIIMDIEMPIMDGLTASKNIRQLPNHTPWIIGLSANAFTESREIALASGMNDYLTKPLQVESLITALEGVSLSLIQKIEYQALDLQTLEALGSAVSKENLPHLIGSYLEHSGEAIANMHQALSNKAIKTIDAENHSLKGGTETFGAIQLSQSCQELQLLCKHLLSSQSCTDENIEAIADILNRMDSEYKLLSQAFQKYLGSVQK